MIELVEGLNSDSGRKVQPTKCKSQYIEPAIEDSRLAIKLTSEAITRQKDLEKPESLKEMEDWQLGSSLLLRYTACPYLFDMKECAFERTKAKVSRLPYGIFNKVVEGIGIN